MGPVVVIVVPEIRPLRMMTLLGLFLLLSLCEAVKIHSPKEEEYTVNVRQPQCHLVRRAKDAEGEILEGAHVTLNDEIYFQFDCREPQDEKSADYCLIISNCTISFPQRGGHTTPMEIVGQRGCVSTGFDYFFRFSLCFGPQKVMID